MNYYDAAKLVACDIQAFQVFSQHPACVYYGSTPIGNAVYCLNILFHIA